MTATEVTYAYWVPSQVRRVSNRSELLLGTSGGRTDTGPAACPYLFQGFLTEPAWTRSPWASRRTEWAGT